ncbi:MAG TPA: hypothetical protein VM146_05675 [Steroidobacteraceae bacterium]|nr:hypothetical protein [Steroidobacteraceae bacterium]
MAKLRSLVSLILLLLLAAVVSLYSLRSLWHRDAPPSVEGTPAVVIPRVAPSGDPPRDSVTPKVPVAAAERQVPANAIAQAFRAATDYLEFVRGIHGAAKAGDPAAQYYLFRSLEYCHGLFRAYFGRPGKSRTLDEGLQWAARGAPALDVDEARRVNDRCRALEESDLTVFGEREQWLQSAALAGQPNAQVEYAGKLLFSSNDLPGEESARSREDARDLVRKALASHDPEVIFAAGNLVALRTAHPEKDHDVLAWMLAACDRGMDCGPADERTRTICRFDSNCQPYESLVDMVRRQVEDFPGVEGRSREINRLIDDGDWDALGFGSAGSP